jgi:hypothetical protein
MGRLMSGKCSVNRKLTAISTPMRQEFRRPRGHSRHKWLRLLAQGLRPTREGVLDICFADGQTNLLLRHTHSGSYGVKGVPLPLLIFGK